jgi:predicted TIM-barrel fold metal-dependent hydrolase
MQMKELQMKGIEKMIDCSTWTGNWPFNYLRYGKLELLKERLEKYNIVKAYVSPIEAILEEDPMRANIALFNEIDEMNALYEENNKGAFFFPVPVVDLSFNNWEELVLLSTERKDVKIVKLLPNYHMYELTEDKLGKLIEFTVKSNLIISIQIRVEDARGQYPLLKVGDVDIIGAIKVLSSFPQQKFIISNGYISDIEQSLYSLQNVYVDISSAETQDVLALLTDKHGVDRILFSTHSAFYYPEGNVFKFTCSGLDKESMDKIGYKNAQKLGL